MRLICLFFLGLNLSFGYGSELGGKTSTGIPLDLEWKVKVYDFAQKNLVHPAWGIAHSERDYQVTKVLANLEGIGLDEEVLFAAAFLHDLGGLAAFSKEGVDHAVQSVAVIEPLMPKFGFPMQKWPLLKEMILAHVYYGPQPSSLPAQAFHDADVLDFLGAIGAARILALTQETGWSDGTLSPTVKVLGEFVNTMPGKCSLKSCQQLAATRGKELGRFLNELDAETFNGKGL